MADDDWEPRLKASYDRYKKAFDDEWAVDREDRSKWRLMNLVLDGHWELQAAVRELRATRETLDRFSYCVHGHHRDDACNECNGADTETPELDQLEAEVLEEAQWAATMLQCPWYRGTGICATGCWDEPACQTSEPEEGWAAVAKGIE